MAGKSRNNVFLLTERRRKVREETREQVLERLFSEHGAALRGFLRVSLDVGEEAEDIVQEVFIKLAKLDNLQERLPHGGVSNRSFLFAIANNLVVDMERSKRVRRDYARELQAEARDEFQVHNASPETITLAKKELEQVKKVLMQMRPCWREAFILNRFRHRSYREIAMDMDISVKTVEKYIKKALIQIKATVQDLKGVEKS